MKPSYMFSKERSAAVIPPLIELAPGLGGLRLDLLQRGRETPGGGPARRMVEDVDGLVLHVLGPFRRGEEVGHGDHDRDVIIKEVRRLGDPPRRQVVFRGQVLRPMLRPVPFREHQAVASGVGIKGPSCRGLPYAAILSKLQRRVP